MRIGSDGPKSIGEDFDAGSPGTLSTLGNSKKIGDDVGLDL